MKKFRRIQTFLVSSILIIMSVFMLFACGDDTGSNKDKTTMADLFEEKILMIGNYDGRFAIDNYEIKNLSDLIKKERTNSFYKDSEDLLISDLPGVDFYLFNKEKALDYVITKVTYTAYSRKEIPAKEANTSLKIKIERDKDGKTEYIRDPLVENQEEEKVDGKTYYSRKITYSTFINFKETSDISDWNFSQYETYTEFENDYGTYLRIWSPASCSISNLEITFEKK